MNRIVKTFLLGILAGFAIGLGGLGYLCCLVMGQKILGSFVFSFGLLTVCGAGLFLYTGKIGYAFAKEGPKPLDLLVGYIGNLLGAASLGAALLAIPSLKGTAIAQNAYYIAQGRDVLSSTGETWYGALLLSILCGILVFIAVDMFKRKPGAIGMLCLIGAVAVFVMAGFEHCIANMFYYTFGNNWTWGVVLNIVITTVGNTLGAWITYVITHFAIDKFKE